MEIHVSPILDQERKLKLEKQACHELPYTHHMFARLAAATIILYSCPSYLSIYREFHTAPVLSKKRIIALRYNMMLYYYDIYMG